MNTFFFLCYNMRDSISSSRKLGGRKQDHEIEYERDVFALIATRLITPMLCPFSGAKNDLLTGVRMPEGIYTKVTSWRLGRSLK